MKKVSSFAERKLSSNLWHRVAKHCVAPQCFPRHQKCVLKRDLRQSLQVTCLVLSPAVEKHQLRSSVEDETHKCRLVSTCALVTTCAKPEPPPSCPAAVIQRDTYRAANSSSGQGLPRLMSVSPHFESVLSRPSPGCHFKQLSLSLLEGGVIFSGQRLVWRHSQALMKMPRIP